QIVNQGSNRCIDATGSGTANGTRAQIYTCIGKRRSNQAWFARTHAPMSSGSLLVHDDQWHHVVLSATGTGQKLYVDGVERGSMSHVLVEEIDPRYTQLGTGYLGGGWPAHGAMSTTTNKGTADWWLGSMAEVSFHDRPITAAGAAELHAANRSIQLL